MKNSSKIISKKLEKWREQSSKLLFASFFELELETMKKKYQFVLMDDWSLIIPSGCTAAELVGFYKDYEVHHFTLEGPSSDTIYDFYGDARIVNGSDAAPGQFPFVARLSITRRNPETGATSGTLCSGSLIHEQFALTASHCVTPNPDWITNVGFLIGTVNRNVPGTTVNSVEFWFLEQPQTLVKDLAMFRFAQPIARTPLIDFIRLPSRVQTNYEFVGWPVTTIGWGVDNTGNSAVHLQFGNFIVISINVCGTRFTEYDICYVEDGTQALARPGDSGAPVIVREGGIMTQVGVHAGRRVLNDLSFHSAARISTFLDWIHQYSGIPIRDS